MAEQSVELIDRLLRSDKLSRDTREELNDFRQQAAKGALDPGDIRYVEALASRLLGGGTGAGAAAAANVEGGVESEDEHAALDANLWEVGEDEELRSWRERAETAEARVAELEAEVAALKDRLDQAS